MCRWCRGFGGIIVRAMVNFARVRFITGYGIVRFRVNA